MKRKLQIGSFQRAFSLIMLKTNKPIALVALLKRVTRVIRSRRSLPKERKEGFALLKEPISLFL